MVDSVVGLGEVDEYCSEGPSVVVRLGRCVQEPKEAVRRRVLASASALVGGYAMVDEPSELGGRINSTGGGPLSAVVKYPSFEPKVARSIPDPPTFVMKFPRNFRNQGPSIEVQLKLTTRKFWIECETFESKVKLPKGNGRSWRRKTGALQMS